MQILGLQPDAETSDARLLKVILRHELQNRVTYGTHVTRHVFSIPVVADAAENALPIPA
jgi:hypothetical protein